MPRHNMFDTSLGSDWLKLRFGSSLGIRIPEMVFDMFDDRQTLSAYVLKIRFCYCSLRKHPFLLAVSPLGTFREEERLRLSDINSILMTQINVYIMNPVVMGFQI